MIGLFIVISFLKSSQQKAFKQSFKVYAFEEQNRLQCHFLDRSETFYGLGLLPQHKSTKASKTNKLNLIVEMLHGSEPAIIKIIS